MLMRCSWRYVGARQSDEDPSEAAEGGFYKLNLIYTTCPQHTHQPLVT